MTAEPEEMEIQVRRERAREETLRGLEWETMCGDWPGLVSVARFVPKISFYLRFPLNFRPLYHPWLPFGGVCFLKKLYDLSVCGCTCTWPQGHMEVKRTTSGVGTLRSWGQATSALPTCQLTCPPSWLWFCLSKIAFGFFVIFSGWWFFSFFFLASLYLAVFLSYD